MQVYIVVDGWQGNLGTEILPKNSDSTTWKIFKPATNPNRFFIGSRGITLSNGKFIVIGED